MSKIFFLLLETLDINNHGTKNNTPKKKIFSAVSQLREDFIFSKDKKELGKYELRLFTKNIALWPLNIESPACPVTTEVKRPRYPDRAKVA